MKSFLQFTHVNGTYACLLPDEESNVKLASLAESLNLSVLNDYHCTIAYSKRPCPAIENIKPNLPITAKVIRTDFFPTKNETGCLVLRLMSNDIHELFKKCQMMGATYDYSEYKPHVTISTEYPIDQDIHEIEPFQITFDRFHVEGLKDD